MGNDREEGGDGKKVRVGRREGGRERGREGGREGRREGGRAHQHWSMYRGDQCGREGGGARAKPQLYAAGSCHL